MTSENRRIYIYIFGCLLIRLLFIIIVKFVNIKYLPFFGIITLILSILFIRSFIKNKKVGFFGGKVWWNNLRLFHSIMYLIFSICSFYKIPSSYIILIFDLLIGLLFFINNYFIK